MESLENPFKDQDPVLAKLWDQSGDQLKNKSNKELIYQFWVQLCDRLEEENKNELIFQFGFDTAIDWRSGPT